MAIKRNFSGMRDFNDTITKSKSDLEENTIEMESFETFRVNKNHISHQNHKRILRKTK